MKITIVFSRVMQRKVEFMSMYIFQINILLHIFLLALGWMSNVEPANVEGKPYTYICLCVVYVFMYKYMYREKIIFKDLELDSSKFFVLTDSSLCKNEDKYCVLQ